MEEESRAETLAQATALVDDGDANDWSKEDDEPMAEAEFRPSSAAAAADETVEPPPQDLKAEVQSSLQSLNLETGANRIGAVSEFNAQLQILELLDNAIFTAGYKAVLHIHSIVEECEVVELIEEIDMKKKKDADPKKKKPKRKPLFVKNGAVVVCRIQVNNLICIENFSDFAQLGRFTLRAEGKTIAIGKVVALPPPGNSTFA